MDEAVEDQKPLTHEEMIEAGIRDRKDEEGLFAVAWSINQLTKVMVDMRAQTEALNMNVINVAVALRDMRDIQSQTKTSVESLSVSVGTVASTVSGVLQGKFKVERTW